MECIQLPASRLADGDHPFSIRFTAPDEMRGASATWTLDLTRGGETLGFRTQPETLPQSGVISVDATDLAPGEYRCRLRLDADGATFETEFAFHRLAEPLVDPEPFAVYAVPLPGDDPETCAARLREVADCGVNLICQHTSRGRYAPQIPSFDEAAALGIRFMPSTNAQRPEDAPPELAEAAQHVYGWDDGSTPRPKLCFGHPGVRALACEHLAEELAEYAAHPAFSGLVYYGDDLFMHARCEHATVSLTCYCETCKKAFLDAAGLDAPTETADERGVVAEDHPWILWNRFRCGETYGGFIRALEETRLAVAPETRMGLVHGFPYAPFTQPLNGIYSPLSMPLSAISSYCYPFLCAPRQDLIAHYELGRMANREKPIWMLGCINSNWTNYPSWQVYQNFWNMLAAGYDFIGFFAWHDFVTAAERGVTEHLDECKRALADCGRVKDLLLPTAAKWSVRPARCAVLFSFTTSVFDLHPEHRGHVHLERVLAFYREALRRRVPFDIICEEEIVVGVLDRYDAVCLHDVRALGADVHARIETYAKSGGTVFVDQDILLQYDETHRSVTVDGAVGCAPETMVAILHDRTPPDITVDADDVTLRRFDAGGIEHLVLVNNVTDQYHGFRFWYWDKMTSENYEHMKYVRDEPVATTVRFADGGRWVADLVSGEVLGETSEPLDMTLEPSWGRVCALLPVPELGLDVSLPEAVARGERARLAIRMTDEAGEAVRGVFTVRIRLLAPDGGEDPRSAFAATEDGTLSLEIPFAANDATGTWTVEATGGFPRRTVRRAVAVTPSEEPLAPLSTEPAGRVAKDRIDVA